MTKHKGFEVNRVETDDEIYIEIKVTDEDLVQAIRTYTDIDEAYNDVPVIRMESLFARLDSLKRARSRVNSNVLKSLIDYLSSENKAVLEQVQTMLQKGVSSFLNLIYLFNSGVEVVVTNGSEIQGAKVIRSEYRSNFLGTCLMIHYEYITSNGSDFIMDRNVAVIPKFDGTKELQRLPVRIATDEQKITLSERGKIFHELGIGAHYKSHKGHQSLRNMFGWSVLRSDGRIMVDVGSYYLFDDAERSPDYDTEDYELMKDIDDDLFWLCDAYVRGFSFETKRWGRFAIKNITNIDFKQNAFKQLVLEQSKKTLIKCLVEKTGTGFKDIVSSKGGGCIFLLHGPPGVGKTLTAEAVAELLERPLYSVSVGELGVTPSELDNKLRQILDIAQVWNAVILIDEADIFLEKRSEGDILRNAMVGIFLRLLEYYQGVLFLTTNRVKEFDDAFHSRIAVAMKYESLDQKAREQVWENLLQAAGIDGLNPHYLSNWHLNGRQIKTTIRLAQHLALDQGVPVGIEHIEATLNVTLQFERDLQV